jgi:hypothetical protein
MKSEPLSDFWAEWKSQTCVCDDSQIASIYIVLPLVRIIIFQMMENMDLIFFLISENKDYSKTYFILFP